MSQKRSLRIFLSTLKFTTLLVVVGSMFPLSFASATCCKCVRSTAPDTNICLTGDVGSCTELIGGAKNPSLEGVNCEPVTLTDSQCQTLSSSASGLCSSAPVPASSYGKGTVTSSTGPMPTEDDIFPPTLNIPIPGLKFANRVIVDGGEAVIPFLAQYVSAVYRYLLAIVVVTAAIAMTYGGFHYMLGTTLSSIQRGKEIIRDSIIGLVLVFSAHLILVTLNPALTDLKGLKVAVVSQKAFSDLEKERQRVIESATVPRQSGGSGVDVPVLVETTDVNGAKTLMEQDPNSPSTAPGGPKPPPGSVIKDANGVYVAQLNCPADMVAIRESDAYQTKTKKKVASFCMDTFEAPNQRGVKPFSGVTDREADWYCAAQGKRLCADSEWTRACLGPKGVNTYGYGPDFIPGKVWLQVHPNHKSLSKSTAEVPPCNYGTLAPRVATILADDSKYHKADYWLTKPETSLIAPGGSSLLQDPSKKDTIQYILDKTKEANAPVVPSGSQPGCVTEEGVFDLSGNVQEIMLNDASLSLSTETRIEKEQTAIRNAGANQESLQTAIKNAKLYKWGNFYYSPVAHLADTNATPTCDRRWGGHASTWRGFENGFRCCMPLNENP